jgi:hypothetical protein
MLRIMQAALMRWPAFFSNLGDFVASGIFFHGRILAAITVFVIGARIRITALTTRFRELNGETKSIVESLLPVMVKLAGMPAGLSDDIYPFTADFISPVAIVPPDAQLCLGIPCFHGAGARIYKIPHDMSSPPSYLKS